MGTELAEAPETGSSFATRKDAAIALSGLYGLPPAKLIAHASDVATALNDVITRQNLSKQIGRKRYVECEGWTTCGAMLGFVPGIERTEMDKERPGVYISHAILTDMRTGIVVARANAECGDPDEKDQDGKPMWANRAAYARRSMSETRAIAKVCRVALSWIVRLAGYEPTPAEEVPDDGFRDVPSESRPAGKSKPTPKPAPAPASDGSFPVWAGVIEKVTQKSSPPDAQKPWTKYTAHGMDGERFTTFDKDVAKKAQELSKLGSRVEVWYENTQYGKDLKELVPAKREPGDDAA